MKKFPITLYLFNKSFKDQDDFKRIDNYEEYFEQVVVLSPSELAYLYPESESKTDQWNQIIKSTHTPWALFLDGNEHLDTSKLEALHYLDKETWVSCLISVQGTEYTEFYHSIRLIPTTVDSQIYNGNHIPDASRYIRKHNIKLVAQCLPIERSNHLWQDIDLEGERSQKMMPTSIHLYEARQLIKSQKYVQASAEYRQIVKKGDVLSYDYLAALNGLARCYAEQHKWSRALEYTEESIAREPQQYMPYLIQFRIYQMNKNWGSALEALQRYWRNTSDYSRSSHETQIPQSETLIQLSNVCLKAGKNELGYEYLSNYLNEQGEKAELNYRHAALTLAIELSLKKEAINHLYELYPTPVNMEFTSKEEERFHDYLELFLNRSWFEPVEQIYTALYHANPGVEQYKRRLIVTLIKSDRLDQAKSLLHRVA